MLAMFAGAEVVHRYYRPDLVSAEAAAGGREGGAPVEVFGLERCLARLPKK